VALHEEARERGCHCGAWDTNPEAYRALGYPYGSCGFCERCGRPGHARHFPGAVPYTGCWCDYHYRLILWLDPRAAFGCLVWLITFFGVAVALAWWLGSRG